MERRHSTGHNVRHTFHNAAGPRRPLAWALMACWMVTAAACDGLRDSRLPSSEGTFDAPDGARLYYHIVGSGPDTIVVVHGGPGFQSSYLVRPLLPLAYAPRTLLFYDLRGRGRSALVDSSRISADFDVADLEAVRVHFGLSKLKLIGHGWGAAVAALYAERNPDHVDRVAMISPLVPRPVYAWNLALVTHDSSALRQLSDARRAHLDSLEPRSYCRKYWGWLTQPARVTIPAVVKALSGEFCDAPDDALRRITLVNRQIMRSLGKDWDLRPGAAGVRAPVLVVEGSTDTVLVVAMREWAAAVPTSRALRLDAPAVVPWASANDSLTRALHVFLDGGWPASARGVERRPGN